MVVSSVDIMLMRRNCVHVYKAIDNNGVPVMYMYHNILKLTCNYQSLH